MSTNQTPCKWPLRPDGFVNLSDIHLDTSDCAIPAGFKGFTSSVEIVDEHGHKVDGDWDPAGSHGCRHTDTPEYKAAHAKKLHKAATHPVRKETPMAADTVPAPEQYEEVPVTASVGAPEAPFDVQALVAKGGSNSTTVMLALIGVASSGAVIKLVKDWMKNRKELEEKRLEVEEKKAEKSDENHQKCAVERMQLTVQMSHLERKIAQLEQKSEAHAMPDFGDFDFDGMEGRLKKLEKALLPAKKR